MNEIKKAIGVIFNMMPEDEEEAEALSCAIVALREKLERKQNEPLTLDELRKMDGEAVYVVQLVLSLGDPEPCVVWVSKNGSGLAETCACEFYSYDFDDYGKTWTAYRHPLKTAMKEENTT